MEFTGERVIPGETDVDLMNEHRSRYAFAEPLAGGKRVLDLGCGVGYGSAALLGQAACVVGLDLSRDALLYGSREFTQPGVAWVEGDAGRLPLRDASFDLVVAFEVIEHLADWESLLSEASRVLTAAGQLIVSTPNRLYYGESRERPNPYHEHEFDYAEFREALESRFPFCTFFFENHSDAVTFIPEQMSGVRTVVAGNGSAPDKAHFFLAVCCRQQLYGSPGFVYVPTAGNVLRERERHVALLSQELEQKTRWLEQVTAQLQELTEIHRADQERAQERIDELEGDLESRIEWVRDVEGKYEERTKWAQQLEQELEETKGICKAMETSLERHQADLARAAALIDDAEQRVIERTEWAQRLDKELESAHAQLAALYASPALRWGRRLKLAPDPQESPPSEPSKAD